MIKGAYLSWLNPLGGFEYWPFTGYTDDVLEVVEVGETTRNIFPGWPKSYGPSADTIRKQTYRRTRKSQTIRSQILTKEKARAIAEEIKSSVVVQIVGSRRNRRNVLVDDQTIVTTRGKDKMHSISFTITFTDDYPSQTV